MSEEKKEEKIDVIKFKSKNSILNFELNINIPRAVLMGIFIICLSCIGCNLVTALKSIGTG